MKVGAFKYEINQTIKLAFPVMLSQFGHIMVGVVDTAMVGQIGTIEQAALALANSIHVIILVFLLGISFGVTPLVAAADSTNNYKEQSSLLKHCLIINVTAGTIFFVILYLLSPTINLLEQDAAVVDIAIPYFNVIMLSLIPMSMYAGIKQFAEGLSRTKVAMLISVAANGINVLLNYVLIFGKWGFPEMGIMGACWASFFARVLMAVGLFIYIKYHKHFSILWKDYGHKRIIWEKVKSILSIGVPTGLQWFFEIGAFSFAVVMIGWLSPEAQAAHQIGVSLAATTYMISTGISAATSVRVANQLGLHNINGVKLAAYTGMLMNILLMTVTTIAYLLLKNKLPELFSTNKEVIEIASGLIIIIALFQISDGLQSVELGILRGIKDVKVPTVITFISYWVIGLPLGYLFGFTLKLNAQGVWYGLAISLLCASIFLFLRFNYITKRI